MLKKKKTRSILAIYIILVLVLCVVVYLLPKVNDSMTQTYLAENGTLQVSEATKGYFVRDEVVYAAGTSGKTEYLVEEGERVRKTAKVMKVEQDKSENGTPGYSDLRDSLGDVIVSTKEYRAGINGVVSYEVDGFEGLFSADDVTDITYEDLGGLRSQTTNLERDKVVQGEPVYKVYDNSLWYMLLWTDKEHAGNYSKGSSVTIEIEDTYVKAVVYGVKKQGDRYRVILKSDRYYEKLATVRAVDVRVITQEATGAVVENESIVEEDGVQGVYVRNTAGKFSFVKVNVLLSTETQSVISESYYYDADGNQVNTVELYDEILRKP